MKECPPQHSTSEARKTLSDREAGVSYSTIPRLRHSIFADLILDGIENAVIRLDDGISIVLTKGDVGGVQRAPHPRTAPRIFLSNALPPALPANELAI